MKPVKAWAIVDKNGRIVTAANNPRVFFDCNDAADEAWKFRDGNVVRVEIRAVKSESVSAGPTTSKGATGRKRNLTFLRRASRLYVKRAKESNEH